MSEQVLPAQERIVEEIRGYLPPSGTRVRLVFRWSDMGKEYTFLQMAEQGIIVADEDEETTPPKQKIYFYTWGALDYFTWFADEEAKKDD